MSDHGGGCGNGCKPSFPDKRLYNKVFFLSFSMRGDSTQAREQLVCRFLTVEAKPGWRLKRNPGSGIDGVVLLWLSTVVGRAPVQIART